MLIKVIIPDKRFIPTLGKGPFLEPIEVSEEKFRFLKFGGYNVKRFNNKVDNAEKESVVENKKVESEVTEETKVLEEEVNNTEVESDITEDNVSEDINEFDSVTEETKVLEQEKADEVEESVVEENTSDTKEKEMDLEKLSNKELKSILDANSIEYKYNDTKSILINKIKENMLDKNF